MQEMLHGLNDQIMAVQQQIDEHNAYITELEQELGQAQAEQRDVTGLRQQLTEVRTRCYELQAQADRLKAGAAAASDRAISMERGASRGAVIPGKTVETSTAQPMRENLTIGYTAQIQEVPGATLRLHTAPGQDTETLDGLAPSTRLTLLEGPVAADECTWWRVRTTDGREGWVAGEHLVAHPDSV
jgi:TolA-binding protein